jgi:hypothetical protein
MSNLLALMRTRFVSRVQWAIAVPEGCSRRSGKVGAENTLSPSRRSSLYLLERIMRITHRRLKGKVWYIGFNALLCYPAPPRGGYIRGANQISGATICALGICYLWILQKYPQLRQCIRAIHTTTQLTLCDTLTREISCYLPIDHFGGCLKIPVETLVKYYSSSTTRRLFLGAISRWGIEHFNFP